MKKLLIFPCNGNGLEALSCIDSSIFEFIGFVDDTNEKQGLNELGFKVFTRDAFDMFPDAEVLAVPGSPASFKIRHDIINGLGLSKERFATVIHPKANIANYSQIGVNVLIMAGVCITHNALINNHVCILPNTVIHHDSYIGEYTLIGSNVTVAGNTLIGQNCYIGSGSSIMNNLNIGDEVMVGMGTSVIRDVISGAKVVGNPARKI